MSAVFILSLCSVEVFASPLKNAQSNNIVINRVDEITDSKLLFERAQKDIHDITRSFNVESRYYDSSNKTKSVFSHDTLSTTQLLETKLLNGEIIRTYAYTAFPRAYTAAAEDPDHLFRVTIYFEANGAYMSLKHSIAILLKQGNYASLQMRNEVYEGMDTDITHSNTRTFQPPDGANTLLSPTNAYVAGGLARISCFARLTKSDGSYVEAYAYCV